MTDAMILEAVRAAGGPSSMQWTAGPDAPGAVADPSAVSRFEAAMGAGGVQPVSAADPIPFASEASAAWRSAQANNQGLLHRIRALSEMRDEHNVAAKDMLELQYEVMNLSFQQQVITKVAEKASTAIQTLVKNQ